MKPKTAASPPAGAPFISCSCWAEKLRILQRSGSGCSRWFQVIPGYPRWVFENRKCLLIGNEPFREGACSFFPSLVLLPFCEAVFIHFIPTFVFFLLFFFIVFVFLHLILTMKSLMFFSSVFTNVSSFHHFPFSPCFILNSMCYKSTCPCLFLSLTLRKVGKSETILSFPWLNFFILYSLFSFFPKWCFHSYWKLNAAVDEKEVTEREAEVDSNSRRLRPFPYFLQKDRAVCGSPSQTKQQKAKMVKQGMLQVMLLFF